MNIEVNDTVSWVSGNRGATKKVGTVVAKFTRPDREALEYKRREFFNHRWMSDGSFRGDHEAWYLVSVPQGETCQPWMYVPCPAQLEKVG